MTTDKIFHTLQTEKAAPPDNGKKASIPKKSTSTTDQLDFMKILQIFVDIDVNILRQMFLKCDKDFVRTIDNILYVKRYCTYLSAMKKHKEKVNAANMQKKSAAATNAVTLKINQNININNAEMPEQNKFVSVNNTSQSSNDSGFRTTYDSGSSVSYVSDPFYNSQDINSSHSSLYSNTNNSGLHLPNGSMDSTNNSLNDTYGNVYFYDPFTNLTGNFRSSTPDIINILSDTLINPNI